MSLDSKALFLGLTGAQRFAILKERERALAIAREQACRTTYRGNAEKPVPRPLVQWGKNLRRDSHNLIAPLITYVDNGAEREMVAETWDGLNQMVDAVYKYARSRMQYPRPALTETSTELAFRGETDRREA